MNNLPVLVSKVFLGLVIFIYKNYILINVTYGKAVKYGTFLRQTGNFAILFSEPPCKGTLQ